LISFGTSKIAEKSSENLKQWSLPCLKHLILELEQGNLAKLPWLES
jgi:hypothetical protein